MFWGYFSYNYTGPLHFWKPDTTEDKKEVAMNIEDVNKILKPIIKEGREFSTGT